MAAVFNSDLFRKKIADDLAKDPTKLDLSEALRCAGIEDINFVLELIKTNKITSLILRYNNLFGQKEEVLMEGLAEILKTNTSLTHLDLSHNVRFAVENLILLAESLKTNKTLINLDLSHIGSMGREKIQVLTEALKKNNTLTTLNLGEIEYIDKEAADALANLLEHNNTLSTLILGSTWRWDLNKKPVMDVDGVIPLAKALAVNKTLTTLGLPFIDIRERRAQAFVEALKVNETLTSLMFDDSLAFPRKDNKIASECQQLTNRNCVIQLRKSGVNAKNFHTALRLGIVEQDERTKNIIKELITTFIEKNIKTEDRKSFLEKEWGLLTFSDFSEIETALEFVPKGFHVDVLKNSIIGNDTLEVELTSQLINNLLALNNIQHSTNPMAKGMRAHFIKLVDDSFSDANTIGELATNPGLLTKIISLSDAEIFSKLLDKLDDRDLFCKFFLSWNRATERKREAIPAYKTAFDALLRRAGEKAEYYLTKKNRGLTPLEAARDNVEAMKMINYFIPTAVLDKKIAGDKPSKESINPLGISPTPAPLTQTFAQFKADADKDKDMDKNTKLDQAKPKLSGPSGPG